MTNCATILEVERSKIIADNMSKCDGCGGNAEGGLWLESDLSAGGKRGECCLCLDCAEGLLFCLDRQRRAWRSRGSVGGR